MSKKTVGIRVQDRYKDHKEVAVFQLEMGTPQAQFILGLIERWGMVAAAPDGEDGSGRQKQRLMAPEEIVNRAFDCASLAFDRLRADGLLIDLPDVNEINAAEDARSSAEKALSARERAKLLMGDNLVAESQKP